MADILKTIEDKLPRGVVSSAIFEGANIIVYTSDASFFKNGDSSIKEIVNTIKKRIELRSDKNLLNFYLLMHYFQPYFHLFLLSLKPHLSWFLCSILYILVRFF